MLTLPPLTDAELHLQRRRHVMGTAAQEAHVRSQEQRRCPVHPYRQTGDGEYDSCPWTKFHSISCVCPHCLYVDYCCYSAATFDLTEPVPMGYNEGTTSTEGSTSARD